MKLWKRLLLSGIVVIVLLLAVVVGVILMSMRPTTGQRIEAYPAPRSALLIIDIQEDFTGPQAKKPYRDGDRIISASNTLMEEAKAKGMLVVYIKNVITNPVISLLAGGMNAPGSPGTEMDSRLIKIPGAPTFTKNQSDAFSNQGLEDYLRGNQVNEVMLTGLDGAYCVNATARGALNRGYRVVLFTGAIATEGSRSMDELTQGWLKAGAQARTELKL